MMNMKKKSCLFVFVLVCVLLSHLCCDLLSLWQDHWLENEIIKEDGLDYFVLQMLLETLVLYIVVYGFFICRRRRERRLRLASIAHYTQTHPEQQRIGECVSDDLELKRVTYRVWKNTREMYTDNTSELP